MRKTYKHYDLRTRDERLLEALTFITIFQWMVILVLIALI